VPADNYQNTFLRGTLPLFGFPRKPVQEILGSAPFSLALEANPLPSQIVLCGDDGSQSDFLRGATFLLREDEALTWSIRNCALPFFLFGRFFFFGTWLPLVSGGQLGPRPFFSLATFREDGTPAFPLEGEWKLLLSTAAHRGFHDFELPDFLSGKRFLLFIAVRKLNLAFGTRPVSFPVGLFLSKFSRTVFLDVVLGNTRASYQSPFAPLAFFRDLTLDMTRRGRLSPLAGIAQEIFFPPHTTGACGRVFFSSIRRRIIEDARGDHYDVSRRFFCVLGVFFFG